MEIVYCGGCGKALLKDEFARGGARYLDNRPWCVACAPPDKTPIAALPASRRSTGSSAKHPRVRIAAPVADRRGLMIGLALAGAGVLLAVGVYASQAPPSPPPTPPPAPVRRPPVDAGAEEAARALKDLESLATLAPADKVLARCDEIRAKLQGRPEERRFRQIEEAALAERKGKDVAREFEEIRKIVDADPKFARSEEVTRRLRALRGLAPDRAAESDRLLAEYQKAKPEPPDGKHAGPFEADEEGFLRHWLVLGPFPNENDKGLDTDFLKGEADHKPAAGTLVGSLSWEPWISPEAKLDFFAVPSLKLRKPRDNIVVYLACQVQVPEDAVYEFRVGSDDGEMLWIDGRQILRNHASRKLTVDQDKVSTTLSRGLHRLLLKVDNHSKGFECVLRILTPDGKRPLGLRIWN